MAAIPPYPLYHQTYSLYRASPLHHGDAPLLDGRALQTHARRLTEQLKGDRVRGVHVDYAAADDTARLGPLAACTWEAVGDEDAWIDGHGPAAPGGLDAARARGIHVRLEYEKHAYTALLLRDPGATGVTAAPASFTALPLLLVKMPGPVRTVFLAYLRTAFDAHVAPLQLPSSFITASADAYFGHLSARTSTQTMVDTVRQLHVQLAFAAPTTLLRHIDITIAAPDVPGFVARGKALQGGAHRPFTAALSQYVQKHLALDVSHPGVRVSSIACSSFQLRSERLKLAAPDPLADDSVSDEAGPSQDVSAAQHAVAALYASLVRQAAGSGNFLPEESGRAAREGTTSSTGSGRAGSKKRAISNAAATDANRKKAKGKSKEGTAPNANRESMAHI
ncbi:hypothetical protein ACEQ8H_005946 [Pleosporales sp. CAS-2024a]